MSTKRQRPAPDGPPDTGEPAPPSLPHNLEAEKAVLGAILMHSDAYAAVTWLRPDHFFRYGHRLVYAQMVKALDRPGGIVDLVTLKAGLGADLDEAGGPAYIASLIDGVPRGMHVTYHAGLVREAALLRGLIAGAQKTMNAAYAREDTASAVIEATERRLLELQAGYVESQLQPLSESTQALVENINWRIEHRDTVSGVPTGFASLDQLTGGWQAGDMIVVGARPSVGKTTWSLNSATACARSLRQDGTPRVVAVFSLEMTKIQLELRLVSSLSKIPLSRLINGVLMGTELETIDRAVMEMHGFGLYIDDRSGQTMPEIRTACRRLKMERGIDLVIIDYAQLVGTTLERRGATRNDEMTDVSKRVKALAKELACPVLLLSQLSRANEKRYDPRPKLSDLRESGAFEQDADLVVFPGHRKKHSEGGPCLCIIEKQRNGPTGQLVQTLDRDIVTFTDGGELPPEPVKRDPDDSPVKTTKKRK